MEFRVLGPVEAFVAGQRIDTGHARQRSVLAVLLLDLGRVVPADLLIDRVWGANPPASVRNVLYGYVAKLRAVIADAGDPGAALTRRPEGYLLEADHEGLDLYRFRRLTAAAAAAPGDDEHAAALLRSALGLWHGPALAGLSSLWLSGMRDTLELQRIAAVLALGDIALRQGWQSEMISVLAGEAIAYPTDERLIGQLMLALYRSGRQAEALRWFGQTRHRLAAELGVDPDPRLKALHEQILRADPSLAAPGPASHPGPGGHAEPPPQELPADVSAFTGRAAELGELDRLLALPGTGTGTASGGPATVVISAVSGTAGVGKTALAVHWAHRVAGRFPDGQLYVNLRGHDPGQPVTAADALAGFLRAMGASGRDIPAKTDERAARYRSLLAGRRMLVVLDNAVDADQVRPLLPGTSACAVVVTSRDTLPGLVARDGALRLDLDLLPLAEAVGLLRALIGQRVDADPQAAVTLARQCSRLPLALRVAAELATSRPTVPLAGLVVELADQQRRLDLLEVAGDRRTAVRAVFSWSYLRLDASAARAFRLLSLHPGLDFDRYAAAAITGTTLGQACRLLDQLTGAHLIQQAAPDRYGMHDLLRAYARDLTAAPEGEAEGRAALTRLFDHYLHTAAAAMDTLFPADQYRRPHIPPPATPAPQLPDSTSARDWLDSQRPSLVAVTVHAVQHGWPGHAARLGSTLFRYLEAGGHYPEAIIIQGHARRAAQLTGDHEAEMTALNALGLADLHQGRCQQATGHFRQVLALCREAGNRSREARALGNLGTASLLQGSYREATGYYQQALTLHRETGELIDEANVLLNLSVIDHRQGRCQQAAGRCQQAIALAQKTGDRDIETYALLNLGIADLQLGHCQRATEQFRRALATFREMGIRSGEAAALARLADADLKYGRHQQATEQLQQALTMFRMMGDRSGEAEAHNGLGEVLLATGQPGDSSTQHTAALDLASQVGDRYEEARAHNGLGHACQGIGDSGEARRHWRRALTLYVSLGAPEAGQVRAQLAAMA